jgi:hypothetical protein
MTRARDLSNDEANSGGATPPFVAGKNIFINGALQIWQRGTSFNATTGTTTAYSADRWTWWGGNSSTLVTRQATGDTTNLPNIQYCARIARPSGNTGTLATYFGQAVETINSIPLAGKTVTVSYYARAGANMSNSAILQPVLVSGTGTDQNYIHSAWTGFGIVASGTTTLTNTWARYSFTGTVPANCTELTFQSYWIPTGTAGANDYYEITGIQLEVGSVATPFTTASGSIGGELALCQRYYYAHITGAPKYICMAAAYSSSISNGYVQYPVTMRTTPTMAITAGTNYYLMYRNGTYNYFNTLAQDYASSTTTGATGTGLYITGLSQTAGWAGWFQSENAAASIAFSAEL